MKAFLLKMQAALVAYGPWGIFLLSVIDSVGVPLPAAMDVLLITIAAGSAKAPRHAYFAAFLAVLGSVDEQPKTRSGMNQFRYSCVFHRW